MNCFQRWIGFLPLFFLLITTACGANGPASDPAPVRSPTRVEPVTITSGEEFTSPTEDQAQTPAETGTDIYAPGPISESSSSEQIRLKILNSYVNWNTLWVDGELARYNPDSSLLSHEHFQAWIDQDNARFRVLVGDAGADPKIALLSDGSQIKQYDLESGIVEELDFLPILTEPYAPPPKDSGIIYPHPLAGSLLTPIADLLFPSALAQREGNYSVVGSETIAERETLLVDWNPAGGPVVDRLWIDPVTGMILKRQNYGKDGSGSMQTDDTVSRIVYNPNISPEIFSVDLTRVPRFSESYEEIASSNEPFSRSPAERVGAEQHSGQIYFVVNDLNNPQLVRIPADCLVGAVQCPPAEIVPGYPNINSTVSPLVWSNDGAKAALVVNDRLYIYQPGAESWLLLVRSDYFYPPVWSPDGSWLAYVAAENNRQDLYIVRPDGSEIHNLTANRFTKDIVNIGSVSWYSPDMLFFIAQARANPKMYRADISGSTWEEYELNGYRIKDYVVFSPDGQLAAGVRQTGSTVNITIASELDKETPTVKEILSLAQSSIWPVAWSNDSERLAFSAYESSMPGAGEAYTVDVQNQQNLKMIYRGGQVFSINWGPEGKHILIEADQEGIPHLFIAAFDDGTYKPLSVPGINPNAAWTAPSWRP